MAKGFKRKKSNGLLIVLLSLGAIGLLAGSIKLFISSSDSSYNSQSNSNSSDSNTTTEEPEVEYTIAPGDIYL